MPSRNELLESLKAGLASADPIARGNAAAAIGEADSEAALDLLPELLEDGAREVRVIAGHVLARTGRVKAAGLLAARLGREPDELVRGEVVTALGTLGAAGAADAVVGPLEGALDDRSLGVQMGAIMALGNLGAAARGAASRISAFLGHPEWIFRRQAAVALGKLGGVEARAALEQLLEDPQSEVREAAAEALRQVGGHSP